MKQWAQFFHNSVVSKWHPQSRLIPACGSDSILYIDSKFNVDLQARAHCESRNYKAYQMMQGNIRDNKPASQIKVIS
jgi:hypothetical protein